MEAQHGTMIEANTAAILQALSDLGGVRTADDALVYEGNKFILPGDYADRPISAAVDFLKTYDQQNNTLIEVERTFSYHPYDVAASFERVLRAVFGTAGFGKIVTSESLFGSHVIRPSYRTVRVGVGETVQVPWDSVSLPILKADFELGMTQDSEGQWVGHIEAACPKRYRGHVEGVFTAIEKDLREHSLFRGKAIDANWIEPQFLDLSRVDESKIAYSAATRAQLQANVWTVVEHTDRMRKAGMNLKRAVLLEGPYGTGKSLTGLLTAAKAVANGWTFVYCKPGQDLAQALHAAELLAPSVVFFEDIDVAAGTTENPDASAISNLLDMFDGVANKSQPIVAVVTTNHVERLHKGMLRPGRLDAVIHVGALDGPGVATLISGVLPPGTEGEIDYDQVAEAMDGFLPAFIKEAAQRAVLYTIDRGPLGEVPVHTEDLVLAAGSLRPQLELMEGAKESLPADRLGQAVADVVTGAVDGTRMVDGAGHNFGRLVHANGDR